MKCFNEMQLEIRSIPLLLVNEYKFLLAERISFYLDFHP